MKKKKSGYQKFMDMSPAERARDVARFDREFVVDESVEAPAEERAVMEKVRKQVTGRPKVGLGAKRVLVTVERSLLSRADAAAKRKKMSRAQFVAQGLKMMLGERAEKAMLKA